jgi:hypothetical protein
MSDTPTLYGIQLADRQAMLGKTVAAVDLSGRMFDGELLDSGRLTIAFTDGSVATFEAVMDDDGDLCVHILNVVPEPRTLHRVGLISSDEYARIIRDRDERKHDKKKAARRRQYEDLKKEFEP